MFAKERRKHDKRWSCREAGLGVTAGCLRAMDMPEYTIARIPAAPIARAGVLLVAGLPQPDSPRTPHATRDFAVVLRLADADEARKAPNSLSPSMGAMRVETGRPMI